MKGDNPTSRGLDFEERVRSFLSMALGQKLSKQTIQLNFQGKTINGEFDLWHSGLDCTIAGQVKLYTWRNKRDFPNGKYEALRYDLVKLALVQAQRKVLILKEDVSLDGRSLINTFIDKLRKERLLGAIEIWRYDSGTVLTEDSMKQVFGTDIGATLRLANGK